VNERRRNWILIWISLIGIGFFLRIWPGAVQGAFDWDWREVEDGPFVDAAQAPANRLQPVRFLGRSPGAVYGAELLHTLGLLGVASGPPASHANARAETLVVPSERCSGAAALQAHLDAGGALLLLAPCDSLSVALGVPLKTGWALPAPEASADLSPGRRARNLPLPTLGAEWIEPAGWESLTRRVGGGVVVMQRGRLVVTSFDPVAWLRDLRQGEAQYADVDRDGMNGLQSNDLRPFPWSGLAWRQPSADAWTELLAWIVGERLQRSPLPRIWPIPQGARSALVLTFDQDFAPTESIEPMLARAERARGEATLLTTFGTRQSEDETVDADGGVLLTPMTRQRARQWGHGFGAHPNAAGLGDPRRVKQAHAAQRLRLEALLLDGELRVTRTHDRQWFGHDAPAEHVAFLEYWMDLSFVSVAPRMRGPGFQFGSGRPARWQLPTGEFLPILSQPTPLQDDVLTGDASDSAGLSAGQADLAATHLLEAGAEWGVPIVANLHPTLFVDDGGLLLDGLLAASLARGLPILSAERWATWSWSRLRVVSDAVLSPTSSGWTVAAPPASVPLQLWTPGEECPEPVRFSPLSVLGCRGPWGG
jgi:hypothetical protein